MKINRINFRSFRKFSDVSIDFTSQFTLLVGENGAGKTSVLDAISIGMGTFFLKMGVKTQRGNLIPPDATETITVHESNQVLSVIAADMQICLNAEIEGENVSWCRVLGDRPGRGRSNLDRFCKNWGDALNSSDSTVILPLFIYYGAGRLWEIHRGSESAHTNKQDGYKFALDPKTDIKTFVRWFERNSVKKADVPAVRAVEEAVKYCIPDAKRFFYDPDREQIVVELEREDGTGECFNFQQMSAGYKNMISMVADIAYRACVLNPHLMELAPRQTEGVILIDELDLHLHPSWQKEVVEALKHAFPKMQFIATSHSPFIVQSMQNGEVVDMEKICKGESGHPDVEYANHSIEEISTDVMGVENVERSKKRQRMFDVATKYYGLLGAENIVNESELVALKGTLDELIEPYSDDVAYTAYLQFRRDMAFGDSES